MKNVEFIELEPSLAFSQAIESIGKPKKLVVCGSDDDRFYIEEGIQASNQKVEEIVERSLKLDAKAWFDNRKKINFSERDFNIFQGEWPEATQVKPGFALAYDMLSGKLLDKVTGASVITDEAWKIPAHFKFGGWNDCPESEQHCAIWRYWQAQYGAKIVGVSNDVIEAYVENPPTTKTEALALATEHYLYSPDIVEQGVETVANLAASIINHNVWFFWWD